MPLARLTNEAFIPPAPSLHIDHETLHAPEAVHWHEFYEILFVVAGAGTHVLNGTAYALMPGSVCVLTPADFHEIVPQPAAPLDIFNVIFTDDLLAEEVHHLLFADAADHVTVFAGADVVRMEAAFRCLWTETSERQAGYQRVIQGALEYILISVARHCHQEQGHTQSLPGLRGQQEIRRSLIYLHHHFREPLTLERVARHAHLSPHYFSTCFHREVGRPFQAYLRDLRLHFARALLCVSDLPVTDVCHAAGFANLPHFDRAFTERYGQAPRAYRRAAQAREPARGPAAHVCSDRPRRGAT